MLSQSEIQEIIYATIHYRYAHSPDITCLYLKGMWLKRDRLTRQQLEVNRKHPNWQPLPAQTLDRLEAQAHEQLSLPKITSREMEFSKIETFLLMSTPAQKTKFYMKLRNDLTMLFNSDKAQKTFQNKWTLALKSNVMGCFSRIAKDFFEARFEELAKPPRGNKNDGTISSHIAPLYVDTLEKLLTTEKMSRVEEKFLEPFLVEVVRGTCQIQKAFEPISTQKLAKAANSLSKVLSQRETPKTLSSNLFLKYCGLRALNAALPHQKYLHNQLLHAPNPKYLLPFRRRGTFAALTNQLLLKSNKLDMVGCQFWSYYEHEEGDLYEKIRKAAEWAGERVEILRILIRPKLVSGLERCLNLINEKVLYFSNRPLNDEGINTLRALVETCLSICENHSKKETLFETALEKVDIGQVFQHSLLSRQSRLRPFALQLLELYLLLLIACPKRSLRDKFIPHLSMQLNRLLDSHKDTRFTDDVCKVVARLLERLRPQERAAFLFGLVECANHEWEANQQLLLSNQIAKISVSTVHLLGQLVAKYGFDDMERPEYKVLKLQFYYILALNYEEGDYYESKPKLSRTLLDLHPSLANNSVFGVLETKQNAHSAFRKHLRALYGDGVEDVDKPEHEGILAVIEQVVTYRIQETKSIAKQQPEGIGSYYALMVSLLEQVQRIEGTNSKLSQLVLQYFYKCKKKYLIEVLSLKNKDETRSDAQRLITRDVSFLIESCVSANPKVADFSWTILKEYIEKVPQLAVYTGVLVVWAECISILYRKSNQQYQSRSQSLRGRWLVSGTLIPTQRKQIFYRMKVLVKGLYEVVLRGHLIDDSYLRTRGQYLIRQYCKSDFGFGWKLLKHLINSFKEDRDFIAKEVLTNNSCSWFVNDEYFNSRVRKIQPKKVILDKYLYPLHDDTFSRDELKKIFQTVEPQAENEFLTVPPKYSQRQLTRLVEELQRLCARIGELQLQESTATNELENEYGQLFDVVSRVKMIFITSANQTVVLSQILGVCRRHVNHRLLAHTLSKIVPFFYCLNEFNSRTIETLAQTLYFIVNELNISCNRAPVINAEHNTFDARLYQFSQLKPYEDQEQAQPGHRHRVASFHSHRVASLKTMYGEMIKFLGSHMHVCIAKGFSLSLLLRVFSINLLLKANVMAQLPLETVCKFLLSHLQLVNVFKSGLEKGETSYEQRMVDYFYHHTLRGALMHFQKEDVPEDELIAPSSHIKELKIKIDFLIQICDYLRNDDFHQLSKKKLPKRNELFARRDNENLLLEMLEMGQNNPSRKKSTRVNKRVRRVSRLEEQINLPVLRFSLLYLISQQVDRTKAYAYPQLCTIANPYSLAGKKAFISSKLVQDLLFALSHQDGVILVHNFLRIFGDRVDNPAEVMDQVGTFISRHPVYNYPPFLSLFVEHNHDNPQKLREINYWRAPHIPVLLQYLSKTHKSAPSLVRYATKVLGQLQADQILFYLPQIFQAMATSGKIVSHFLLEYARKSSCFAHQLIWLAQVESKQERDPQNKSPRLPGVQEHLDTLKEQSKKLIRNTICQFNREETGFWNEVNEFYEKVTAISGKMRPQMAATDKKDIIRAQVQKIFPPKSAYLPFNPTLQVVAINQDSGTPMQSAAKCPFLLSFFCVPYQGPDAHFAQRRLVRRQQEFFDDSEDELPQEELTKPMNNMSITVSRMRPLSSSGPSNAVKSSRGEKPGLHNPSSLAQSRDRRKEEREVSCIFKVFDDIRQDCLALQVIKLFLQIFERHKLGLSLFPYHTISNRTGSGLDIGGIIEVVPNCVSRDSLGKTNQESLYEFFVNNFGAEHNMGFQQARQNFIRSQAAYSVVSYILQVKDRHNGNIMIDKEQGYLVHIDFGFMFGTSPANNLRFERAAFKLTEEMIRIMGGSLESEPFQLYLGLVIKAFLLARRYHEHITNLVTLMAHSGLPCFLQHSLPQLRDRFMLHLSEIEAAEQIKQIVVSAADHWTTNWYDRIQWIQQKIYH